MHITRSLFLLAATLLAMPFALTQPTPSRPVWIVLLLGAGICSVAITVVSALTRDMTDAAQSRASLAANHALHSVCTGAGALLLVAAWYIALQLATSGLAVYTLALLATIVTASGDVLLAKAFAQEERRAGIPYVLQPPDFYLSREAYWHPLLWCYTLPAIGITVANAFLVDTTPSVVALFIAVAFPIGSYAVMAFQHFCQTSRI